VSSSSSSTTTSSSSSSANTKKARTYLQAELKRNAEILMARRRRRRKEAKQDVIKAEGQILQRFDGPRPSSVGTKDPLGCNISLGHPREYWSKLLDLDEQAIMAKKQVQAFSDDLEEDMELIKLGGVMGGGLGDADVDVDLLELPTDSREYKAVLELFTQQTGRGSHYVIAKIEAVKSPIRLGAYMFKREQFANDLGEFLNERWLWHGTNEKIVMNIAHQGFLRQFLGTATDDGFYGRGIYFAPNAGTSCGYARVGSDGMRRMFLCRVLVGQYHAGYRGLKQPQAKPGEKYIQHESTVDNIDNPHEYVIYQDDQAYPEFLITFSSSNRSGFFF